MKKIIIIYLLFLVTFGLSAQEKKDEFWSGLSFSQELTKKMEYTVKSEYRGLGFEDQLAKFLEFGTAYKFNKFLGFKAGTRFSDVFDADDKWRIHTDVILKWSKKKWPLKVRFRNRFQYTFLSANPDDFSVYRSKLKLSWKLAKRFYFNSGFEYFYKFGDKNKWDTERFFITSNYTWKKGIGLSLGYIVEQDLNKKNVENKRALVVGLSYQIKRKSKSKSKSKSRSKKG
mgnify:CR=1 FL=1